ncbi:MAG: hypothetical protein ACR2MW_00345 [Chthoniobacterales bacterium]
MRRELLLAPFLAVALSLTLGACAKKESAAEREAEINRRVDERLAAEHAAQEKAELDQRAATVAERERHLASREAFFATMTASLADDSAANGNSVPSGVADPYYDQRGSYASDNSAPAAPTGAVVPGSYEFEPRPQILDDTYLLDDPYYYYGSTFSTVALINQNTRIVNSPRRPARTGMHGHPRPRPPAPRPIGRTPRPNPGINRQPRPRPVRPIANPPTPRTSRADSTALVGRARRNPR